MTRKAAMYGPPETYRESWPGDSFLYLREPGIGEYGESPVSPEPTPTKTTWQRVRPYAWRALLFAAVLWFGRQKQLDDQQARAAATVGECKTDALIEELRGRMEKKNAALADRVIAKTETGSGLSKGIIAGSEK